MKILNKQTVVIAATLVLLILFGAVAVYSANGGKVYTGCLNAGGQISNVVEDAPSDHTCPTGQRQITWNEKGEKGDKGDSCTVTEDPVTISCESKSTIKTCRCTN